MERKKIAVYGLKREQAFRSLFQALEKIYPVSFFHTKKKASLKINGAIIFDDSFGNSDLIAEQSLIIIEDQSNDNESICNILFTDSEMIDSRIRGGVLADNLKVSSVETKPGDSVLATCDQDPIWITRKTATQKYMICKLRTEGLEKALSVSDLISQHLSFVLIPFIQFVKNIIHDAAYKLPQLRATFIIDDPNFRRFTYGFVDFRELIKIGRKEKFHVTIAAIPIDFRKARHDVVDLFMKNEDVLSITIHGNNHILKEFSKKYNGDEARRLLSQALRRADLFSNRFNANVTRIAVPPHGNVSGEICRDIFSIGFNGLCASFWAYENFLDTQSGMHGLGICDFMLGAFPVIERQSLSRDDVLLKAFLDRPLIYYFHHHDLKDGLGVIVEKARNINRVGNVQWMSLGAIAASNYSVQEQEGLMRVRLFSQKVHIEVPESIGKMLVEIPCEGEMSVEGVLINSRMHIVEAACNGIVKVGPLNVLGDTIVVIEIIYKGWDDYQGFISPRSDFWAVLRRSLTESRDRVVRLVDRLL
jgi:hypothetical protein